jgi:hypothetical protein
VIVVPSEARPDGFEVALRTWSAQEEIVKEARAITALLGLDPALVLQMQAAARGDDAIPAMREHVADLVAAVNEELAARSS